MGHYSGNDAGSDRNPEEPPLPVELAASTVTDLLPSRTRGRRLAAAAFALALLVAGDARAQTFADPDFVAQTVVTMPQFQVVGMAWANDGAMFIFQKNGLVRIFRNGSLLSTPFIDLRGRVNTYDDRGMLGLALDPDFDNNGYVYLAYVFEPGSDVSDTGPKISRLTRVTANPSNHDVALANSEVILIDNIPADGGGHTAGTIRFAPDGTLFLANGDGATASFANSGALGAQDIDSLRGKILRVNPDGTAPAPPKVPNPYYDGTNSIRSKVFAIGLRNAFRFDFHPTLGDLYACDVGWNTFEEVDRVVAGGNYGWPCYEAFEPEPDYQDLFPSTCDPLGPEDVTDPIYAYGRSEGSAVVGGIFYTGGVYPQAYANNFFFSDYTGGWMRRLVLDANGNIAQNVIFATSIGVPVSTEVGPDGLLYYADYVTGQIRRIQYNGPVAAASATPRYGYSPLQVAFSSAGSSGQSLSYSWNFGDGGTSTAQNPSHTYVTGGVQTYQAVLTVQAPGNNTATASVPITVGSLPPMPTIQSPQNGSGVEPGETVNYSGSATDPDQTIPASGLHWEVLLHHNTHIHSFVGGTGSTGSFVAEYHGVGNYAYELILTATDASGLSTSTSVQIPVLPDSTPPTDPTNLNATAASAYAINLSWSPSTDNAAVSSYRVERCAGVSCNNFGEIGVAPGTTFADMGLTPQTTYRYRVRAADPTGNLSGYSNIDTEQTLNAPPPPVGLVAAYAFNENGGFTAGDLSGTGNAGTVSGATWATGKYGQALTFDGINDVVVVPDSSSLDLTSGATFEAWVYPTATLSNWKAILQKEVDAYFLNANTGNNRLAVGGTFAGVCCTVLEGPNPLPANQWTHVAGTYNGSTLRLYVNGTQVASQARTGNFLVTGTPLRIGGNTYGGEFFPGRIDEVRIYNRALSAAEIQTDMATPLPEPGAVVSLLAGAALLVRLHQRARSRCILAHSSRI
jgi:glucose/arabinose dehydrogenase/chitodextrinase